jgi:hypothetical protein
MKFHELQAKRAHLQNEVRAQEIELQKKWNDSLGGNHPVMMGLNLLSSTFSRARFNPYVSVLQAAVFVYQDFKEQKLPNKDNFLEYFMSLASRLTKSKDPNHAA